MPGYLLRVRDKLAMAGFVVLLVAVWGVGFLWVRGDLDPSSDKVAASKPQASKSATPARRPVAVCRAQRPAGRQGLHRQGHAG